MTSFSLQHTLSGHQGSVYTLAYDEDSCSILSGGGDRILASWNLQSENLHEGVMLARAADVVYSLAIAGNTLLIGQGAGGIHLINRVSREEERLLQPHEGPVFGIYPDSESRLVTFLSGDGTLSVYTMQDFEPVSRMRISEKKLRTLVRHPVDGVSLIGCGDGSIALVDSDGLKFRDRLQVAESDFSINAITFFPDGSHFLCGGRDAMLYVYSWDSLRCVESIPAHNYAIYGIAFSGDGSHLATVSRDKTVKLWEPSGMKVVQRLEGNDGQGHVNSVNTLLWLPDGRLVTAGDDRAIRIWSKN
jgi:WD40 repeat protein